MYNSKSCVDFVKLSDATTSLTEPSLDVASKFAIEPAHGEEVVRAVVVEYGVRQFFFFFISKADTNLSY